ncbi:MAG TPA: hypothetical protein VKI65_20220 [Gemmataceae bacterium]|nr:hypothetical protein [Gemmataceae bacterium]
MKPFKTEAVLTEDGTLTLHGLPFKPGAKLEVIIFEKAQPSSTTDEFPLRDSVLRYERPNDPVAEDEWEAAQ